MRLFFHFQLILVSYGFSLTNHEAQKLLRALYNTEWHAHLALSMKNFYGEIISWFMKEWLLNNGSHNEMAIDARKCQRISTQEMLEDRL